MNEFTKNQSSMLKAIAILFMVGLHLYNRVDLTGYYHPYLYIGEQPIIYIVSFLFDACVPLFLFCAGYAAYVNKNKTFKENSIRIFKLMINYWIILIFTLLLGILFNDEHIPGNFISLLGNLFLYNISYVGAWWFMQTYVILTLASPIIIKLIDHINEFIILLMTILVYCLSYYFRIIHPLEISNIIFQLIANALILCGTSLLPYVIGMMFRKQSIISFIRKKINTKFNNLYGFTLIFVCIIIHWIIKSLVIAPFVAVLFVVAYALLNINSFWEKVLLFLSKHSTNIWLLHMQFYMIFMSKIVFSTNTVIGCYAILLFLCIVCSIFINSILSKINNKLKIS